MKEIRLVVSRMRQSATDSGAAQLSIDMIEAEILEARTKK
jgi:hypothetical protein